MGWSNQAQDLIVLTEAAAGFSGLFGYSPAPGPGNLVMSAAAANGTDPFGNAYLAGNCSYFTLGTGTSVACQVFAAAVQFYTAASPAGPWVLGPFMALGMNPATDIDIFAPGALRFSSSAELIWVDPAGDSWAVASKTAVSTAGQNITSATLQPITGLAATLQPGTYRVSMRLFGLCSAVSGVEYTPGFLFSGAATGIVLSGVNWQSGGTDVQPLANPFFGITTLNGLNHSPPAPGGGVQRESWTDVDGVLTVTAAGTLEAAALTSSDVLQLYAGCLMEVLPIV